MQRALNTLRYNSDRDIRTVTVLSEPTHHPSLSHIMWDPLAVLGAALRPECSAVLQSNCVARELIYKILAKVLANIVNVDYAEIYEAMMENDKETEGNLFAVLINIVSPETSGYIDTAFLNDNEVEDGASCLILKIHKSLMTLIIESGALHIDMFMKRAEEQAREIAVYWAEAAKSYSNTPDMFEKEAAIDCEINSRARLTYTFIMEAFGVGPYRPETPIQVTEDALLGLLEQTGGDGFVDSIISSSTPPGGSSPWHTVSARFASILNEHQSIPIVPFGLRAQWLSILEDAVAHFNYVTTRASTTVISNNCQAIASFLRNSGVSFPCVDMSNYINLDSSIAQPFLSFENGFLVNMRGIARAYKVVNVPVDLCVLDICLHKLSPVSQIPDAINQIIFSAERYKLSDKDPESIVIPDGDNLMTVNLLENPHINIPVVVPIDFTHGAKSGNFLLVPLFIPVIEDNLSSDADLLNIIPAPGHGFFHINNINDGDTTYSSSTCSLTWRDDPALEHSNGIVLVRDGDDIGCNCMIFSERSNQCPVPEDVDPENVITRFSGGDARVQDLLCRYVVVLRISHESLVNAMGHDPTQLFARGVIDTLTHMISEDKVSARPIWYLNERVGYSLCRYDDDMEFTMRCIGSSFYDPSYLIDTQNVLCDCLISRAIIRKDYS